MRILSKSAPALLAVLATSAGAQNELFHYDGTTEFTSRGSLGGDPKTLLQRHPADQSCGAVAVSQVVIVIQDQNTATSEQYQFQVRANDPANPGTPDMSPAGLVGSGPVTPITFPGGPISAVQVTITIAPTITVPTGAPTVPGGDFYVALDFPASPFWSMDGISVHISGGPSPTNPGEMQSPNAPGYTGVLGVSGMAWEMNNNPFAPSGPNLTPTLPNRAWRIATRLTNNVTQGFADNLTAFAGLASNPNYGYAGIWPDMNRMVGGSPLPDGVGFRVRGTTPIGSLAFLLIGIGTLSPPVMIPGIGGSLCHAPIFDLIQGPVPTTIASGQPAGTSEAVFGPYPGNPSIIGGTVYAQGVTAGAGGIVLASMCTMSFY